MGLNKGWLERRKNGKPLSIIEVSFHRAIIKKIPKLKGTKIRVPTRSSDETYYVLDKKVDLGELSLVGNNVFNNNEIIVVQMTVAQFRIPLRLLGKVSQVTSYVEYKRLVFEGNIKFSAVHKGDFDLLLEMDDRRRIQQTAPPPNAVTKSKIPFGYKK